MSRQLQLFYSDNSSGILYFPSFRITRSSYTPSTSPLHTHTPSPSPHTHPHTYTHNTHTHHCRDEQYRSLWSELETLAEAYSSNSEHHRQLLEFILQTTAHSPSMQVNRKTPPTAKSENSTPATTPTAAKTELAWQEVDRSVLPAV